MEFFVESEPTPRLCMVLTDQGPGISNLQTIFDGKYASKTGMGLGIVGAKRLNGSFSNRYQFQRNESDHWKRGCGGRKKSSIRLF